MLSERINELFDLLQCTNSDIARFADCSPSNISRLKSGARQPKSGNRSVTRLARGIYRYADYENMLDVLCGLCGTTDTRADVLIPATINWLYETREYKLPQPVTPKSKREKINRQQSFSERLDKVMTMLDYTNSRLAADLNVDISLISRYRTGIYYPNRNLEIKNHLSELLLTRAEKSGHMEELSVLCAIDREEIVPEVFGQWLYGTDENRQSEMAELLFHSIDDFTPGQGLPVNVQEPPAVEESERYWGTEGLRNAVIRFLTDAAREGGEMLLYSDEPMDWMSGDPKFFGLWASLMMSCLQKNVHIRIIHNFDRDGTEMVSAISGWFPLYISGNIEPYSYRKEGNTRFHHTIFLRPERACIFGFFPAGSGEKRWYDYITDKDQLSALRSGFDVMLDSAAPLLKTYPAHQTDVVWSRFHEHNGKTSAILKGLSVASMPEQLLESMLSRAEMDGRLREKVIGFHRIGRENMRQILENGELHEFLCLPEREDVIQGRVYVNFRAETNGFCLPYTPEDYAAHLAAVQDLVQVKRNYHLTLLPYDPFQDLQVFTMKGAAAVVRNQKPYTVFVFYNSVLLRSVDYYCSMLASQNVSDRTTVIRMLDKLMMDLESTDLAESFGT